MAIRPIDEYTGKVATDANYPDGKAQNITSPGDGTGTPWEAKLVNDIFGFQQYLTNLAGITPSGTPDNVSTSQYFQAIWKLLNVRPLTYNIVSDVDLTLTAAQNLYAKITITDTGVVLTTGRNVIVDDVGRIFIFTNSTAQTLTVKTAAGTGVAIPAGASSVLVCDETDVINFNDLAGSTGREVATAAEIRTGTDNEKVVTPLGYNSVALGWGQTWQEFTVGVTRIHNTTYTNTSGKPITVIIEATGTVNRSITVDGKVINFLSAGSTATGAISFIVPNNSIYKSSGESPNKWFELR